MKSESPTPLPFPSYGCLSKVGPIRSLRSCFSCFCCLLALACMLLYEQGAYDGNGPSKMTRNTLIRLTHWVSALVPNCLLNFLVHCIRMNCKRLSKLHSFALLSLESGEHLLLQAYCNNYIMRWIYNLYGGRPLLIADRMIFLIRPTRLIVYIIDSFQAHSVL